MGRWKRKWQFSCAFSRCTKCCFESYPYVFRVINILIAYFSIYSVWSNPNIFFNHRYRCNKRNIGRFVLLFRMYERWNTGHVRSWSSRFSPEYGAGFFRKLHCMKYKKSHEIKKNAWNMCWEFSNKIFGFEIMFLLYYWLQWFFFLYWPVWNCLNFRTFQANSIIADFQIDEKWLLNLVAIGSHSC